MIKIFETTVPLYGIFFFAGIAVAVIVALILSRKEKVDVFDFFCAVVYVFIGALLGAKLLFVVVSWQEILRLKLNFLQVLQGGFVFYGGLLGGIIGLWLYTKQFKERFFCYADIFALVLPLGHAFGRIGCLCAGCCYGIEYHGACSITYHHPADMNTPIGIPLLPIQAIESILLFLFFIVLLLTSKKRIGTGECTFRYALGYATIRFVLEFFRGDTERGVFLALSTSQWISLMILMVVCAVLIWKRKRNKL